MLTTHLNSLPYTKFVLIQDSVNSKGRNLLEHLLENHARKEEYDTHYFIFERNFTRAKPENSKIICHDFTSDVNNWIGDKTSFDATVLSLATNCVVVIDSLAHACYSYETQRIYRVLNELVRNKTNVLQVVAVLHGDLLVDKESILGCFQHLSTLHMELEPKLNNHNLVRYTYKKSGKKVITEIEEYYFDNRRFVTQSIKKLDKAPIAEVLPESLSTFKISLSDKDKESRSHLVLPYLPKEEETSGGAIHYTFDEVDDWDEEDPDDDLDI